MAVCTSLIIIKIDCEAFSHYSLNDRVWEFVYKNNLFLEINEKYKNIKCHFLMKLHRCWSLLNNYTTNFTSLKFYPRTLFYSSIVVSIEHWNDILKGRCTENIDFICLSTYITYS